MGKYSPKKEYKFNIIPFNDNDVGFHDLLKLLGKRIDCFISPCGTKLSEEYGFLPLGSYNCLIALSKDHYLAQKELLDWKDLENESLLLIKSGESYILDDLRSYILKNQKKINIIDYDKLYDLETFNLCESKNFLMETLDIWTELHPSLKTLPVNWDYKIPYGIIYSKKSDKFILEFIQTISNHILQSSN